MFWVFAEQAQNWTQIASDIDCEVAKINLCTRENPISMLRIIIKNNNHEKQVESD